MLKSARIVHQILPTSLYQRMLLKPSPLGVLSSNVDIVQYTLLLGGVNPPTGFTPCMPPIQLKRNQVPETDKIHSYETKSYNA